MMMVAVILKCPSVLVSANERDRRIEMLSKLEFNEDELNATRPDIFVEGICNITLNGVGFTDYVKLVVKNKSQTCVYMIENISVVSTCSQEKQLKLDNSIKFPIELKASRAYTLILLCTGKLIGPSCEVIVFNFSNERTIKKEIKITVHETFQQKNKTVKFLNANNCKVIKGEKPVYSSSFLPIKLPRADVPNRLWEAVLNQENLIELIPSIQEPLGIDNYVERFSSLLFLEEIEMNLRMRQFDISRTSFSHHGEYLSLVVEGLSESRPSLMVGDSVVATPPCSSQSLPVDVQYEGIIHEVLHSKVLLKFHPNFHSSYGGEDFSVQLCFNRTPLRRCHQAVSLAAKQLGESVLFPSKLNSRTPQVDFTDSEGEESEAELCSHQIEKQKIFEANKLKNFYWPKTVATEVNTVKGLKKTAMKRESPSLLWFNNGLNREQKTAVKRILEGSLRPLPYIIFGPPGTGKTVTMVEAILQVYKMISHSRLLVVSPSNSASDLIAERAIKSSDLRPGELIRINAFNRCKSNISSCLEPYCFTGSDLKVLVRHRIIISTAVTAGLLYNARIKNGHFTHIFIDEAGQLTEPETLISMNLVNSTSGQIVLAGDPKQLGPVVTSSLAKKYGLNLSFLHRLCSSIIYQPQDPDLQSVYLKNCSFENITAAQKAIDEECLFEPGLVTLLVKNYRSHADLIHVSSKLFYNSLLIPSSHHEEEKYQFLEWKELPNPSCPLLFHPVCGENLQEGDSPSWFNPAEVYQVSHYTLSLLKFGIKPDDIGIIAPYKKQVEKIRRLLNSYGVEGEIKVGPVEEFQGQEKLAVIVSTVRSSENLIEGDVYHNLGFVSCAERFNVSITRAMGLLIVVGNPFLLSQDANWNELLTFCLAKNAVKKS